MAPTGGCCWSNRAYAALNGLPPGTLREGMSFPQVLRLMEAMPKDVVASAVTDAIRLGAIGFDAVKLIALARLERRPPRLDLAAYPHLPRTMVRTTVAADYAVLVPEVAA